MAVEALLAALEQDAHAEAARVRAGAQERAAALIARAAAEVDRRWAVTLERLTDERRVAWNREAAAAERALRRGVLEARAATIDRVFSRARERLARLDASRYADLVPDLVRGALAYLETRDAEVVCPEDARAAVEAAARGNGEVRVASAPDARPGVLARSLAGDVVVDNTFVARLERMRPDLAIALAARLEGPDALG